MVVIFIPFVWNFYLELFQKERILSLVFEGSDPEAEYNLVQSKAAIASGGLSGNTTGIMTSVPVKESDFIYSAVSGTSWLYRNYSGDCTRFLLHLPVSLRSQQSAVKVISIHTHRTCWLFCVPLYRKHGNVSRPSADYRNSASVHKSRGTAMLINFMAFGIILNISMSRKPDTRVEIR